MNLRNHLIHWIASHVLNIAFTKLFYTYLFYFYLCGAKSFVLKPDPYFTFSWFVFVRNIVLQYFWCFLYKVIGNQGCFSYSTCDLLGKAIKTVFWKTSTNAYPQYFVIHYIAKYQSIRYTIKFIDVLPLCV